jgi:PEP-CTERM motif
MKSSAWLSGVVAFGFGSMGAGAANAALVHDLVTFTASDFIVGEGANPAPADPVTGSFTISFDPTLTYTDQTAGITLDSLNITLGSALSFSYSPTTIPGVISADELIVGGVFDGAAKVQYTPSTDDFWLFITNYTTSPTFDQLGYSQTSVSSDNLFYTVDGTGTVSVTSVVSTPEPSTWAMLLLGFAGLGFLGYRQAEKARVAAA